MSDLTNVFTNIADAIRNKANTANTFKPTEMANAINNISTGVGTIVLEGNPPSVISQINIPVNIPDNVTNLYQTFSGLTGFNCPVNIPANVTNMARCFNGCANFNYPVDLPASLTGTGCIQAIFQGCAKFNQPVNIPNIPGLNLGNSFYGCREFNQPLNIPDSTSSLYYAFRNSNFNQPFTVPTNVADCKGCFQNSNFNQVVTFPATTLRTPVMTALLFSEATKFNQPINIPSGNYLLTSFLSGCTNFNSSVTLNNQINNVNYMLQGCTNFNQPVNLQIRSQYYWGMFDGCTNFNQPVKLGYAERLVSCNNMLSNCTNFNAEIDFGVLVGGAMMSNACGLLYNCASFNRALFLKANLNFCNGLNNCKGFGNNIYILGTLNSTSYRLYMSMLYNKNNLLEVNVHTRNPSLLAVNNTMSMVGRAITWTSDGANGFYNTGFNIHIVYNQSLS